MKVYNVTDNEFKSYGRILENYDFNEIFEEAKKLPITDNEIVYEASLPSLEKCQVKKNFKADASADLKFR